MRDGDAEHCVRVEGMPEDPRRRALAAMQHAEDAQRRLHPLQRLMLVVDEGGTLQFATTGQQLIRQLPAALLRIWRSDLRVDCTDERHTVLRWRSHAPAAPIG